MLPDLKKINVALKTVLPDKKKKCCVKNSVTRLKKINVALKTVLPDKKK